VERPNTEAEQLWHAVKQTLGADFSDKKFGCTVLTMDNTGNVYKGVFDPKCSCTEEKWKVHHPSNAFGTVQNQDPVEDRYYMGLEAHGNGNFNSKVNPP